MSVYVSTLSHNIQPALATTVSSSCHAALCGHGRVDPEVYILQYTVMART